jgi:hypothetical protein
MSRVMVSVWLRVCTSPARYLSFLEAISEKMARAFAEGVTTSNKMSPKRCGLKNPVRVRAGIRIIVRVRVKVRVIG